MLRTKRAHWRKLDNAAKIFPATSSRRDTRVFRFYCELRQPVHGEDLQQALDNTVQKYEMFLSVMRKGLFWYYLEKSDLRPIVKEEKDPPCMHLYIRDRKSLLFEVTYFKNRINFEVYHALTDGTGAVSFLKELVKQYLLVSEKERGLPDVPFETEDITVQDMESDSFSKYYSPKKIKKEKKRKTYQLHGPKRGYGNLSVIEGVVSCKALLAKAREKKVSITVFLTAVFLWAIQEEMPLKQKKKPIALMVPVNLRKFFPSASMLNFFGWIEPGVCFGKGKDSLEDVLSEVKEYFEREVTKEQLSRRMSEYIRLEQNPILRLAPLEIKNLFMQIGARLSGKDVTAIFSNLGNIKMPGEYQPYIKQFGFFTSTPSVQLCMCSFQDEAVLSFTSFFQNQNIQRNFLRILEESGIPARIVQDQFPEQKKTEYKGIKFFRGFSFACLAAAIVAVMVNAILTPHNYWSAFVIGGAASMWLALAIGFFKRHNLLKNGIWQLVIVSLACIIWDRSTGWRGWSLDYVYPGVCLTIIASEIIITKIQKLPAQEYLIYYIMAAGFGLIPFILILTGVLNSIWLSVLCCGISFLLLSALMIFKWKNLWEELYKKLHF